MWFGRHYEGDCICKTCSLGTKIKKGGRPPEAKKGSLGRGKNLKTSEGTHASNTTDQDFPRQELVQRIQELSTRPSVNRTENFNDNFDFMGEVKEDFNCAVCREILGSPIETKCEHYFCAGCLGHAIGLASTSLPCPVCKEPILPCDLKQPTRMVLPLLGELKVECKLCKGRCNYEDSGKHICPTTENAAQGVQPRPIPAQGVQLRPIPAQGVQPRPIPQPAAVQPRGTIEQAILDLKDGMISPEVERLGTLFVKSKMKESNDGSAVLKTGGKVSQYKLNYTHLHY